MKIEISKKTSYCSILFLWFLSFNQILMTAESETLKPFSTDGCSMFPDGTLKYQELWLTCCIEHDKAYWRGGTYEERKVADKALQKCVASVGVPKIAALMLAGVRVGGSPYWPTPFRWGYGWSESRGYKALTEEELAAVQAMDYSLKTAFYQATEKGLARLEGQTETNPVLAQSLDNLIKHFDQYQIYLVSLDKRQEYCDILDAYKRKEDIVITFKYRGNTRLTLTHFDAKNLTVFGSYPISSVVGTSKVDVELKFKPNGTAYGEWKNFGFKNEFNIVTNERNTHEQ